MTELVLPSREDALRAAVEVAVAHGVPVTEPTVLADGFNVVAWLWPAPVVARVVLVPALLRSRLDVMIARELAVTEFLAHRDVSGDELTLVRTRFDRILPEVLDREPTQYLHGDAHPGNLLRTPRGRMWADFEECMRGPIEWDLAILADTDRSDGATALKEYGAESAELVPFRTLRRIQAACWIRILAERFPEHRARARALLDRLR